jgi:hypothetical protein
MLGAVGHDAFGDVLRESLCRTGLDDRFVACLNAEAFRPLAPSLAESIDILVVIALQAESRSEVVVTDLPSAKLAGRRLSQEFAVAVLTAGSQGVAVTVSCYGCICFKKFPIRPTTVRLG